MMESALVKAEAQYKKSCPLYDFFGLKVLELSDESFKVSMPLNDSTCNHVGMIHAGVLFAAGEILGGMVVSQHLADPVRFQPVVRDLKIEFLKPALTEITASAHFDSEMAKAMNQELAESGRFDFVLEAQLKDTNNQVVAKTTANYALRNFLGKS
ncbi:MAG: PaaI family thioesterase [Halioglobus sp.]